MFEPGDRPPEVYWIQEGVGWVRSDSPHTPRRAYGGSLIPLAPLEILKASPPLPPGQYVFYFAVDTTPNGRLDEPLFLDAVQVTVQRDTIPPTIQSISPMPSPSLYADNLITLSASVTDTDPSPLEYQFSVDGVVKQAWSTTTSYPWATTSAMAGSHTIKVEVRDTGGVDAKTQTLYLYHTPPRLP